MNFYRGIYNIGRNCFYFLCHTNLHSQEVTQQLTIVLFAHLAVFAVQSFSMVTIGY
jgi:hypothetical protein